MDETFKTALSEYFNEVDMEKDVLLDELKKMQLQLVKHGKLEMKDVESNQKKEKLIKKLTTNGKVLVREIERLKDELMMSKKDILTLDRENKKLKNSIEHERGHVPHLQCEIKNLMEENSYLKDLVEDSRKLKEQANELHELEHQVSFQQNLCNEYSLKIEDKDKQIKNLQGKIETLQEQVIMTNQLKKDSEELNIVKGERDQIQYNYEGMQKVAENLEEGLKELTSHNENLRDNLTVLKETSDERLKEIRELQHSCKILEQGRAADGKDLESQQETIRQLHNENIVLGRQIEALKKDLNVNKMTMDTVKYEEVLLKEELKVTHRKLAEMEGVNKRWQARERELLEEMAEAKTRIAYLNNSQQASEERAKSAQDELDRTVEKLNQVQLAFERRGDRETDLQREILLYVKKCSKLEQDMLLLNKKTVKLRKNLEDSENQRGAKQMESIELQEKLSANVSAFESGRERIGQLQQQMEATRKRTLNLEVEIEEREREKRCLRNELELNENKFDHFEHEIERLKNDSARLRQELKNSSIIIEDLNEKLRNCIRDKKDVECKCESITNNLKAKGEDIAGLKKDLEDRIRECKFLKTTICKKDDEVEDKTKIYQQIVKQLDITRQENIKYEKEVANLQNCVEEQTNEINSNRRSLEQLQDDLDNARRKYLKLESTYRSSLEENENLEQEVLENRKKIMEMSRLQSDLESNEMSRRKEIECSRRNIVNLEQKCEDLERALHDTSLSREKDRRQLENCEEERIQFLREVDNLKGLCKDKEQQISHNETKLQRMANLEDERQRYLKDSEDMRMEVNNIREKLLHAETRYKLKESDYEKLRRTLSDYENSMSIVRDENEELRHTNKSITREVEILKQNLERTETNLNSESQEVHKLQTFIDNEFSRHNDIKGQLEKLQLMEKTLREENDVANAKITDLETLNHDTMQESGKVTVELMAAQEKIKQNEAHLATILLQKERMGESLSFMQREVVQQTTSMENIKEENIRLHEQLEKSKSKVENFQQELLRKSAQNESLVLELSTIKEDFQDKIDHLLSEKSDILTDFNVQQNKLLGLDMDREMQNRRIEELETQLLKEEQEKKKLDDELNRALTVKVKFEGKMEESFKREEDNASQLKEVLKQLELCEQEKQSLLKEKELISLDNEQLRCHHSVLSERVDSLNNQITFMEKKEENLTGEKKNLEKERHNVLQELNKARAELELNEEKNRKVSNELVQTRERLTHSESENEVLLSHRQQYNEEDDRYKEEIDELRKQLKEKNEDIERLQEETKALKFQNQDVRVLLDNERGSRNAERESLLAELSSVKRNSSENTSLKEKLDIENRMLRREYSEMEEKLKSIEKQRLSPVEDRISKRRYSDVARYSEEIELLKRELRALEESKKSEIENLAHQMSVLKQGKDQEISILKSRLEDGEQTYHIEQVRLQSEAKEDEIQRLKIAVKNLEHELDSKRRLEQGITPEIEMLLGKVETYELNKKEAETQKRRLIEELEDQGFELDKLQSKINSLLVEKENYKREIDGLKRENWATAKEKEQAVDTFTTEIRVLQTDRGEMERLKKENERLHEIKDISSRLQRQLEGSEQENYDLRQELQSIQSAARHYEVALKENRATKNDLKELELKHRAIIERLTQEKRELMSKIQRLERQEDKNTKSDDVTSKRQPSPLPRTILYVEPEQDTSFEPVSLTIKPSQIKKSQAYLVPLRREIKDEHTSYSKSRLTASNLSKGKPFQRSVDDLLNEKDLGEKRPILQPRPSSTDPRITLASNLVAETELISQNTERSLPFIRNRHTDFESLDTREDVSLGQTASEIRASFESLLSLGSIGSEDTQGEQNSKRGGKFVNRLVADFEGRQKRKPTRGPLPRKKVDIFS